MYNIIFGDVLEFMKRAMPYSSTTQPGLGFICLCPRLAASPTLGVTYLSFPSEY